MRPALAAPASPAAAVRHLPPAACHRSTPELRIGFCKLLSKSLGPLPPTAAAAAAAPRLPSSAANVLSAALRQLAEPATQQQQQAAGAGCNRSHGKQQQEALRALLALLPAALPQLSPHERVRGAWEGGGGALAAGPFSRLPASQPASQPWGAGPLPQPGDGACIMPGARLLTGSARCATGGRHHAAGLPGLPPCPAPGRQAQRRRQQRRRPAAGPARRGAGGLHAGRPGAGRLLQQPGRHGADRRRVCHCCWRAGRCAGCAGCAGGRRRRAHRGAGHLVPAGGAAARAQRGRAGGGQGLAAAPRRAGRAAEAAADVRGCRPGACACASTQPQQQPQRPRQQPSLLCTWKQPQRQPGALSAATPPALQPPDRDRRPL
jgi:hypothetical protein